MLLEQFDGKVPDNMTDLLKLPGVGRKTANLILGDIYHQPAIVTDTHCIRLSNRLGFVKNEKGPGQGRKGRARADRPGRILGTSATGWCSSAANTAPRAAPNAPPCPLGAVCPSHPIG